MKFQPTLAFALICFVPTLAASRKSVGEVAFALEDPRGDDHGSGKVTYPIRDDMKPGDLDLVEFAARNEPDGTTFIVSFAREIRRPEVRPVDSIGTTLDEIAKFGFYTFNVDVYIDTDRETGSGSVSTFPGRIAEVALDHAWEKAILLSPRPYDARDELKRLSTSTVRRERKAEGRRLRGDDLEVLKREVGAEVEKRVHFPTRVEVSGSKVRFFVPAGFLGGPARPEWSYVVFVTGSNVQQSFQIIPTLGADPLEEGLMVVPVEPGQTYKAFGGGDLDVDGYQPAIIDLLTAPGTSQETILDSFDPSKGLRARLPGVVPAKSKTE